MKGQMVRNVNRSIIITLSILESLLRYVSQNPHPFRMVLQRPMEEWYPVRSYQDDLVVIQCNDEEDQGAYDSDTMEEVRQTTLQAARKSYESTLGDAIQYSDGSISPIHSHLNNDDEELEFLWPATPEEGYIVPSPTGSRASTPVSGLPSLCSMSSVSTQDSWDSSSSQESSGPESVWTTSLDETPSVIDITSSVDSSDSSIDCNSCLESPAKRQRTD
jgi:hypothetical protein